VGLKVDFDMALLVLASGLYRLVAQRMRGYGDAQARQIFRDLINMPADVEIGEKEVSVSFHRRAHLPIIRVTPVSLRSAKKRHPCWISVARCGRESETVGERKLVSQPQPAAAMVC
jgi:hypothetical protein